MMQNYNKNILHMILESNLKSLGSIAVEVIKAINDEYELEAIENIPPRQHHQRDMIVDALLRSFETANLARNLIVRMGYEDSHTAYVSGLLRNIGELCFLSSAVPNLPDYHELAETGLTNEQICLTLCGCDYDDLSEQIVEIWELPITINDSLQQVASTECGKAVQVANELTQAIRSGRESKAFTQVSKRLVDEFDFSFKETVDFVREGFHTSREEFGRYVPGIKQLDGSPAQATNTPVKEQTFDSHGITNAVKKIVELGRTRVKRSTGYTVLADALYNFAAFEKVVVAIAYMAPGDKATTVEDNQRVAADQLIQAVSSVSANLR